MNADRLAELEALADAATPGPWVFGWADDCQVIDAPDVGRIAYLDEEQTAAFIATARTAVPDLLAALREARELAESEHEGRKSAERVGGEWKWPRVLRRRVAEWDAAFDAAKEIW